MPSRAGMILMMVAALLLGVVAGGYFAHGYTDAKWDSRHNDYITKQSLAREVAVQKAFLRLQAEQERADTLSAALIDANAEIARVTETLKKRVTHVSTVYVERPGVAPVPLPSHPFTVGWVHDYNRALGLRVSNADAPASNTTRTSPGVSTSDPIGTLIAQLESGELARSAVSQADVLETHHVNAAICQKVAAQLNTILDFDEGRTP